MSEIPSYEPEPIDNSSDIPEGREGDAARRSLQREQNILISKEYMKLMFEKDHPGTSDERKQELEEKIQKIESTLGFKEGYNSKSTTTYKINGEEVEPTQEVIDMMGDFGEGMSDIMLGLTGQIKDINKEELGNTVTDMSGSLFSQMKEQISELLDQIAKIEELAPGFTENTEAIHNELELVLQLEEDSPQLDALKEYFDDLEFPLDTLMGDIENGGGKEVIVQTVSEYLNTINGALARLNINKLNTKALD